MVADEYAEVFRQNGLAVLLYDHRNLGSSGGHPRQEINPWVQCRGYLDAIDFVQSLDRVDGDRIGLWGDSYSGGEVLVVKRIRSTPRSRPRSRQRKSRWRKSRRKKPRSPPRVR